MALYEHVLLTRPDISSQQNDAIVEDIQKKVEDAGGKIERTEYWGLRNLAYRINKNRKAHYSLLNIEADAEVIHELERQHRINEDILRYMSIRVDEFEDGPSAIMAKREEKKKRERRD